MIIPGILVVVDEDVVNDKVLPALKSIEFGVSNVGDLAKGLSITLIVLGSFVLVLSFIGACGACCETKCLLMIVSFYNKNFKTHINKQEKNCSKSIKVELSP